MASSWLGSRQRIVSKSWIGFINWKLDFISQGGTDMRRVKLEVREKGQVTIPGRCEEALEPE